MLKVYEDNELITHFKLRVIFVSSDLIDIGHIYIYA